MKLNEVLGFSAGSFISSNNPLYKASKRKYDKNKVIKMKKNKRRNENETKGSKQDSCW
tara:strand:+ start:1705 stop:1878 length:174 start_codon:yes stop_codon:yes gene_type:complete